MILRFRNLDVDPSAPVEQWGFEGVLAAVERGSLHDWRRIAAAVRLDPGGKVAGELREAVDCAADQFPSSAAVLRLALPENRP